MLSSTCIELHCFFCPGFLSSLLAPATSWTNLHCQHDQLYWLCALSNRDRIAKLFLSVEQRYRRHNVMADRNTTVMKAAKHHGLACSVQGPIGWCAFFSTCVASIRINLRQFYAALMMVAGWHSSPVRCITNLSLKLVTWLSAGMVAYFTASVLKSENNVNTYLLTAHVSRQPIKPK